MARRRIDIDDLLDADQVAELLGVSSGNAVRTYRSRYTDFPDPVLPRQGTNGKDLYFLRGDIEKWRKRNPARRRNRDERPPPS